jgi:hypothetical protein
LDLAAADEQGVVQIEVATGMDMDRPQDDRGDPGVQLLGLGVVGDRGIWVAILEQAIAVDGDGIGRHGKTSGSE